MKCRLDLNSFKTSCYGMRSYFFIKLVSSSKLIAMRPSDLKYLFAFIIPALVYWGVESGGTASYAALIFAFGIVPVLEQLLSKSTSNLDDEERKAKSHSVFFDFLLFLNLPIVFGLLFIYGSKIMAGMYGGSELLGNTLSMGLLLASSGINVAHELGHKDGEGFKLAAVVLLIPSLYTHFYIEHNRGHHKNVATPEDPATAGKGEILYIFWFKSLYGSYKHAWLLEFSRLRSETGVYKFFKNQMFAFSLLQVIYVALLLQFFGVTAAAYMVLTGVISFLFLESINYIEHYGLSRRLLDSGRYERVQPWHSWNSNHYLGRIILYELTRHSDHHFLANKKYQLLDHHDSSPQLPYGYPSSMLLSMVPPLWFKIMNGKVERIEAERQAA